MMKLDMILAYDNAGIVLRFAEETERRTTTVSFQIDVKYGAPPLEVVRGLMRVAREIEAEFGEKKL